MLNTLLFLITPYFTSPFRNVPRFNPRISAALSTHAKELAPEQRTKIESQVKFVATLAERLDASGDSNDRAGAASNFTKRNGVLEAIRNLTAGLL